MTEDGTISTYTLNKGVEAECLRYYDHRAGIEDWRIQQRFKNLHTALHHSWPNALLGRYEVKEGSWYNPTTDSYLVYGDELEYNGCWIPLIPDEFYLDEMGYYTSEDNKLCYISSVQVVINGYNYDNYIANPSIAKKRSLAPVVVARGLPYENTIDYSIGYYNDEVYPTIEDWNTKISGAVTDGKYQDGYNSGYNDGYSEGTLDGYHLGYEPGFTAGKEEGYAEGESVGYGEGYTNGEKEGYASGKTEGIKEGYANGKTDGYSIGFEEATKSMDFTTWIGNAVKGFLDFTLFGNVTLGGMLGVCVAVGCVMLFLKFFAG